jgi:hypothetical protein
VEKMCQSCQILRESSLKLSYRDSELVLEGCQNTVGLLNFLTLLSGLWSKFG